jgi:hypothetical protein
MTILAKAKRTWTALPLPSAVELKAGVYWLGEISAPHSQASATGAGDLSCFGWKIDASNRELQRPCMFTAQAFAAGPKADFGPGSTCGGTSIDVYGTY